MSSGGKKLIFFGNEQIATGTTTSATHIRMLIEEGYEVCAVIINHEKATSRTQKQLEVVTVAETMGIPVLIPKKLRDITDDLTAFHAEAAVLVAYGKIIPQEIIDIFPKGIINVHPSLLPKHRGPTPIESVILNGETQTGVSIMSLVKEMDAGPVYGQAEVALQGSETKQELADHLSDVSTTMLKELLPGILDGSIIPLPQDSARATYDELIQKHAGVIDWNMSSDAVERSIRAYQNWPKSRTKLADIDVVITAAKVSSVSGKAGSVVVDTNRLFMCCNSGSVEILTLVPVGKKEMTAEAFLAGHKHKFAG